MTDTSTTDNIKTLFPDRPSAIPRAADPVVIEKLEALLAEAKSGKLIGLAFCAFSAHSECNIGTLGKISWSDAVGNLAQLQLEIQLNSRLTAKQK